MDNELLVNRNKNKKGFFGKMPPFLLLILDFVKLIILAFIIVLPIHHFIFQPFYVVGPSMEPNFYDNDYLIIDKVSYRLREPQRGEVIIFKSLTNPKNHLIKRLVGLPGEKIEVRDGGIYIYNENYPQGFKIEEKNYLTPGTSTPGDIQVELKENEYYVLGDNRNMSMDSRIFGPITKKDITGKAWFRGWPLKEMGIIKIPAFAY